MSERETYIRFLRLGYVQQKCADIRPVALPPGGRLQQTLFDFSFLSNVVSDLMIEFYQCDRSVC